MANDEIISRTRLLDNEIKVGPHSAMFVYVVDRYLYYLDYYPLY